MVGGVSQPPLAAAPKKSWTALFLDITANNKPPPKKPGRYYSGDMFLGWPVEDLLATVPSGQRLDAMAEIIGVAGRIGLHPRSALGRTWSNLEKLAMRMGWADGDAHGFACLQTFEMQDKVHVWVVTNTTQEDLTFCEDAALFPSDSLITRLRLIAT